MTSLDKIKKEIANEIGWCDFKALMESGISEYDIDQIAKRYAKEEELFLIRNFTSLTQGMTSAEVGAYVRLLIHSFQNGLIPTDKDRLMRITGILSKREFNKIWENIEEKVIDL